MKIDNAILTNTYVIKKRKKQWLIDYHQSKANSIEFEDEILQQILTKSDFLLQINSFTVVNLNYVTNCFLDNSEGFLVINETIYHIPRRFISQVKNTYKKYFQKKLEKQNSSNFPSSPKAPISKRLLNFNIDNVIYLTREGTLTTIEFRDGKQETLYEPLKNCGLVFNSYEDIFFRINRNTIVNMKYIEFFKVEKETKNAEIIIGKRKFIVSRRQLSQFKQKYRK